MASEAGSAKRTSPEKVDDGVSFSFSFGLAFCDTSLGGLGDDAFFALGGLGERA